MSFKLKPYEDMKSELKEQVTALRGKHGVATIDKLHQPRRYQVQVLNAAIVELDKKIVSSLTEVEKAKLREENSRILSGLMIIVEDIIRKSYSEYNLLASSDGCLFGPALKSIVNITPENVLDSNSKVSILASAMRFYADVVFVDGNSKNPFREQHAFSAIEKFDVLAFSKKGIQMRADAQEKVFDEGHTITSKNIKERERKAAEDARKAKGGGSMFSFSFLGGGTKKSAKKEEEEEEVVEDTPTL